MNELPELPDAIAIRTRLVPDGPEITVGRGFSDEQMRSYALSAVQAERERCARICDYHDKDCAATRREHDVTEVAAAIRSPAKE